MPFSSYNHEDMLEFTAHPSSSRPMSASQRSQRSQLPHVYRANSLASGASAYGYGVQPNYLPSRRHLSMSMSSASINTTSSSLIPALSPRQLDTESMIDIDDRFNQRRWRTKSHDRLYAMAKRVDSSTSLAQQQQQQPRSNPYYSNPYNSAPYSPSLRHRVSYQSLTNLNTTGHTPSVSASASPTMESVRSMVNSSVNSAVNSAMASSPSRSSLSRSGSYHFPNGEVFRPRPAHQRSQRRQPNVPRVVRSATQIAQVAQPQQPLAQPHTFPSRHNSAPQILVGHIASPLNSQPLTHAPALSAPHITHPQIPPPQTAQSPPSAAASQQSLNTSNTSNASNTSNGRSSSSFSSAAADGSSPSPVSSVDTDSVSEKADVRKEVQRDVEKQVELSAKLVDMPPVGLAIKSSSLSTQSSSPRDSATSQDTGSQISSSGSERGSSSDSQIDNTPSPTEAKTMTMSIPRLAPPPSQSSRSVSPALPHPVQSRPEVARVAPVSEVTRVVASTVPLRTTQPHPWAAASREFHRVSPGKLMASAAASDVSSPTETLHSETLRGSVSGSEGFSMHSVKAPQEPAAQELPMRSPLRVNVPQFPPSSPGGILAGLTSPGDASPSSYKTVKSSFSKPTSIQRSGNASPRSSAVNSSVNSPHGSTRFPRLAEPAEKKAEVPKTPVTPVTPVTPKPPVEEPKKKSGFGGFLKRMFSRREKPSRKPSLVKRSRPSLINLSRTYSKVKKELEPEMLLGRKESKVAPEAPKVARAPVAAVAATKVPAQVAVPHVAEVALAPIARKEITQTSPDVSDENMAHLSNFELSVDLSDEDSFKDLLDSDVFHVNSGHVTPQQQQRPVPQVAPTAEEKRASVASAASASTDGSSTSMTDLLGSDLDLDYLSTIIGLGETSFFKSDNLSVEEGTTSKQNRKSLRIKSIEKKRSLTENPSSTTDPSTGTSALTPTTSRGSTRSRTPLDDSEYDLADYYKRYRHRHMVDANRQGLDVQIVTSNERQCPHPQHTPTRACLCDSCTHYNQSRYDPRFNNGYIPMHKTQSESPHHKNVSFSDRIYINETHSPEDYQRFNVRMKQVYAYLASNPQRVREIRNRMNYFKEYEMSVHETSRRNTHFFRTN